MVSLSHAVCRQSFATEQQLVMLVTLQHIFQCTGPISCRLTHSKSTSLLQIAYSVYTSTVQSQVALNRCCTCGTWLQTVETALRTARTQLGFGLQNRRIRSFLRACKLDFQLDFGRSIDARDQSLDCEVVFVGIRAEYASAARPPMW